MMLWQWTILASVIWFTLTHLARPPCDFGILSNSSCENNNEKYYAWQPGATLRTILDLSCEIWNLLRKRWSRVTCMIIQFASSWPDVATLLLTTVYSGRSKLPILGDLCRINLIFIFVKYNGSANMCLTSRVRVNLKLIKSKQNTSNGSICDRGIYKCELRDFYVSTLLLPTQLQKLRFTYKVIDDLWGM